MRWLTNFYDFRFKSTARAAIGIHSTKAWLSQLVNFKNAIWAWGHFRRTICNKIVLNLEKMPQKSMQCFRRLFDNLAWIEHQFLNSIRDSRKPGSLWGMIRGVGGVRKSIRRKRPALFKSAQWDFHLDNAPVHHSILVTDYLTKMGIKTVPQPPYSLDLSVCDFCLFPKLRGRCYETIEEMKEAMTKVIDTLTRGTPCGLPEIVEMVQPVQWSRRKLLQRGTRVSCVYYQ